MDEITVVAELAASIWKIEVTPGTRVAEGDTLAVLESMKMEIPIMAPADGTVLAVLVSEGQQIQEGQAVATMAV